MSIDPFASKKNLKLRVMIVEDEPDICMALKIIIKNNFACEEIIMTSNGEEAWNILKNTAVDLIISDWIMPRLNGDRLLDLVRAAGANQTTPFLMLTVKKDPESVMSAIKSGVTSYIVKPFGQNTIISKVESMVGAQHVAQKNSQSRIRADGGVAVAKDAIVAKLKALIDRGDFVLPALPDLIVKIEDALDNPATNSETVSGMIEMDQAIAAKVIGVANSPFYKGTNKSSNVSEALLRIGLQEARQLVFIISSKSLFTARDPRFAEIVEQLFMHSVATGAASQCLARTLKLGDPHEYFLMGLLHDIGKLIILQILSDMAADNDDISLASVMESMDSMHNSVGKLLLEKWRFPAIFGEIALRHEDVSAYSKPDKELSVVHFCNILVRELGYSFKSNTERDMLKHITSRHLLDMNKETLDAAYAEVREYIGKVKAID